MRITLILIGAAALILIGWSIHPGIGIFVALSSYGAIEGFRSRPSRELTPDKQAELERKKLGY